MASAEAGGGTRYVDGHSQSCSDAGSGTEAAPYCTVQAAADAVTPGQTVVIDQDVPAPGTVHVTRSGTEVAPITFTGRPGKQFVLSGLAVTGAAHLRFQGMYWAEGGVAVSSAEDVSFDHDAPYSGVGPFHVTDGSTGVRLTRSWFLSQAPIVVDKGSTGTVISGNYFASVDHPSAAFVSVDGATGTAVTGNTMRFSCGGAVSVGGRSTGTTIENNVVMPPWRSTCATSGIQVAADSTATTKSAYNLFNPDAAQPIYTWSGVSYPDLAAFRTATGQGDHDLSAPDGSRILACQTNYMQLAGPLAVDSADSDAPGALPTDIYGTPRTDDPTIPDTGAGGGHYDRGAVELGACPVLDTEISGERETHQTGARSVRAFLTVKQSWDLPGTIEVAWGDGTTTSYPFHGSQGVTVEHTYARAGIYTTTATTTLAGMSSSLTLTSTTMGSQYRAVTPVRALDTRDGTGAGGRIARIPARGVQHLDLSGVLPKGALADSAVVNITAVNPGAAGFITAYETSRPRPLASTLNFTKGAVVANLATLPSAWGIDLYNGSDAPVDLVVDLAGYYQRSAGDGFHPTAPTRLLDTRKTRQVPAHGSTTLKVAGVGPVAADASAVMLNVTEAKATAPGFVTAYPAGIDRPTASNLNFTPGAVVPNSTVVPVGADGSVTFYNGSAAPVDLVVDVQGYYSPTGGMAFQSVTPTRVLDTRDWYVAKPVAPFSSTAAYVGGPDFRDDMQPKAVVLNTTVTGPTAAGFLTAYPAGTTRPTASNLNFAPNQTLAAMTVSGLGSGSKVSLYNGSYGSTHVVADFTGYFYG
ncbi:right-handed parallel beta-helix repeat-containing protein [Kitasatospora sp. MMS16-BH015]|uniref:right-handed parallel beta-helix repeat-containing protein n=1 Tax=Kitasatospora sp. MMS16-BH015 TaxID=2018025 RepID=UPI000CF230E2|nr:right-handed parallel beta-helix repeat-containing protein [Kitasatospora sp. MMS16-BH015]